MASSHGSHKGRLSSALHLLMWASMIGMAGAAIATPGAGVLVGEILRQFLMGLAAFPGAVAQAFGTAGAFNAAAAGHAAMAGPMMATAKAATSSAAAIKTTAAATTAAAATTMATPSIGLAAPDAISGAFCLTP